MRSRLDTLCGGAARGAGGPAGGDVGCATGASVGGSVGGVPLSIVVAMSNPLAPEPGVGRVEIGSGSLMVSVEPCSQARTRAHSRINCLQANVCKTIGLEDATYRC